MCVCNAERKGSGKRQNRWSFGGLLSSYPGPGEMSPFTLCVCQIVGELLKLCV